MLTPAHTPLHSACPGTFTATGSVAGGSHQSCWDLGSASKAFVGVHLVPVLPGLLPSFDAMLFPPSNDI